MCIGTNLRGEPCRQIKMHGKETCKFHENDFASSSDEQNTEDQRNGLNQN